MFTTGSKWFFGLGIVSFVLAAAYGWSTGGDRLGPVTAGYWGAVGDHFGYMLLTSLALLALLLGIVSVAIRDADPAALAEVAGTDDAPPPIAPTQAAYWPVVGAFGAALLVLGLVVSNVMFVVGLIVLFAVLVEWMVLAWSDRATGDPEVNRQVRARLMAPFEVPLAGVLVVGVAIFAFSRLFLTSSQMGAVWVATGLAAAILLIGALIATRPTLSANVLAGVLALCAVGVVAAGVVAAARGERTIEPHEEGHDEDGHELRPYVPAGSKSSLGDHGDDHEEEG